MDGQPVGLRHIDRHEIRATLANQLAVEGMRALTQRQSEIVQEAAEEASSVLRDWAQPDAPRDRFAKSLDVAKLAFERRALPMFAN
jgi:hypothetical protein